jgi:hypothetical protein
MSSSTDFRLVALTREEAAYYDRQRASGYCLCSSSRPYHTCLDPVRFELSYTYITGAHRRRSVARRHLCQKHALEKAKKLGLEMPAGVELC